jgi:hypothetical protein
VVQVLIGGIEGVIDTILTNGLWISAGSSAAYNYPSILSDTVTLGTGVYQHRNIGKSITDWLDTFSAANLQAGWAVYRELGFLSATNILTFNNSKISVIK